MRRGLLALVAVGALGVSGLMLALFAWPDGASPYPTSLNLGPVEQYEVGSATRIAAPGEYDDLRWSAVRTAVAPQMPRDAGMWLVRLEDGSVRMLLARDPHQGCTTPWLPDTVHEGREGWFRAPCRSSTFDLDGRWVAGVSARDMDWFEVEVRRGEIVVDLTTLHPGEHHGGVPADGRPRPSVAGWSAR